MARRNDGADDGKWSDAIELKFLEILYERVKVEQNGTPSFKSTDWRDMDNELYLVSGERFGSLKLLGKYNRLRQKYRKFSDLLEHTGVTYQSSLNTVYAPEDVWQMFFMRNKVYKTFRNKSCANYELLGQVFNRSTATGQLHHASSQLPPSSDEECQNEENFMNYGVHVPEDVHTPEDDNVPEDDHEMEGGRSGGGSSKGKRSAENVAGTRRSKKGGSDKWEPYMEMMTSSASARIEYLKEKTKKCRGEQSEVTSPLRDTYSVQACMQALERLDGVSQASYNNAVVLFKEAHWRKVFMMMSVERRKGWLEAL